jgi:signal transduction histidine kinase
MSNKFKILVVDDDLKNIQVGINFLKQNENYHLVFATSGELALERIKETSFDLILLDIIMPVMDGYEVCRRLKSDSKTKQIPVIFLTAKHEEDSLMKAFEVGGADYITKPFKAPELNARVRTHLDLHHHYKKEIAKLHQLLMCSQKAETIRFIAGGIAHDCNNFMMSIPHNLFLMEQRMKQNGLLDNDCQDLMQGVNTATKNVSGLLDQLCNFTSRDDTVCEIVDMNEVVSDLSKVYKDYARYNIEFDMEFFNQPIHVFADKLHVEQVLLNILLNAQHAILDLSADDISEGGRIRLQLKKTDGQVHENLVDGKIYLVITIEDNGIGMSPEVIEKIFDPYFSTRKGDGGSGLGLAVSQEIVQSHEGILNVTSKVGEGTCFHIYFPCQNES